MLSPNFYTLIGALDSAYVFIGRYYRIPSPKLDDPTKPERYGPESELGLKPGDWMVELEMTPATGDPHLDPLPGMVRPQWKKLKEIKEALLEAEGELSLALFRARRNGNLPVVDGLTPTGHAWKAFRAVMEEQTFIFATVARRLMWQEERNPDQTLKSSSGAPEWEMMDRRLRRILRAFAEIGLGGGDSEGSAGDYPGILGSSNESISF
jgi:hypothetical protein